MITINNPEYIYPIDEDLIPRHVKYLVYQLEIGEEGTPHLQMYLELRVTQRLSWIKRWLGNSIHAEVAHSDAEACRRYCMKEDTRVEGPYEYGVFGREPKADLRTTMYRAMEGEDLNSLMESDPISYSRHRGVLKKSRSIFFKKKFCERFKDLDLRPWQCQLVELLNGVADERRVFWVCGRTGGEGKTSFGKYLVAVKDAFMVNGGRNEDIIYAYDYNKIVILDFARCQDIRYDLIEHFKDGILFNQKYESHVMYFEPVHVVVMSNNLPDYDKISSDRIVLFEL